MADEQFQYIKLPNGEYGKFRADASDDVIRSAIMKDFPDAFRKEAGPFTEGFAHSMGFSKGNIPVGEMLKEVWANLKQGAGSEYQRLQKMTGEEGKPLSQRGFSEALFVPGMAASGVEGIAGGVEKALKDIFTPGRRRYGAGELLGSTGQAFAGAEVPRVAGAATEAAEGGVRAATTEMLGVPERAIKAARDAHTDRMAELQLQNLEKQNDATMAYQRELQAAEEEYARKREDTSQTNLQKEAAHKLKVEQIKEKHARSEAERQETYKQKVQDVHARYEAEISNFVDQGLGKKSTAATAAEVRRKAITSQPRSGPVYQRLKGMVDRVATEDVPKLEKTVRQAYDARWGAWREAMGDTEGNFSPVQQAVIDAESDILKGSPENISIFRNILKEGEDPVLSQASVFRKKPGIDVKSVLGAGPERLSPRGQERILASLREAGIEDIDEGFNMTPRPGENVMLPIDQIRGYGTELQAKMFRGGFSGDVYRALKHVQEAANREVERVAQTKGQLATYRQLKSDWAQFLGDFLDSDGSLTKLKNAANADSRLNLISGSEGQNIIAALGRYSKFLPKDVSGQTPIDIAGRTRSLVRQLRDMPSSAKPPERGELPSRPEPRPEPPLPAAPVPKEMPEFKPPQMKDVPVEDIVPFDLPKFVEERVNKRAEQIGIAGHTLLAYWVIRDIFHGQVPSPQMLAVPLVQAQIRRYLTSPRFIQKITQMAEGRQ